MRDDRIVKYRFKDYRLYPRNRRLLRGNDEIHLEPKSFDALVCLVENAGDLVQKQQLVDTVWASSAVTDNSLTRCIHHVRAALEDNADKPEFIETVAGSGYRFIAEVETERDPAAVPPAAATRIRSKSRAVIVASVIAIVVATIIFTVSQLRQHEVPRIERIAVLPLTNLTGDAAQEYFVQGVHEALIAELSRTASIDVISRTSVMGLRETSLDIPAIAELLNVDAVIEGSVMRAGDKLTVTAQLIATHPERHLWAERYHRDVSELFEITTEIVSSIASEIAIELTPGQVPSPGERESVDPQAYDAYLLGRFYFEQRNPDGYERAQEYFRQSIEIDSDYAPAYVGLAHTFGSAAIFGIVKPAEGFPEARRLARHAVMLDDEFANGHLILAGVSFYWDWDWEAAASGAQYALRLDPNLANAYRLLAEVYSVTGRHEEALTAIEKGRSIDPLPPTSQLKPSLILYLSRDYDAAIARAQAGLEHYPNYWQGHWLLCVSLAAASRHHDAIRACERAAELSGNTPMAAGALGYVLALAGQDDDAMAIARELEAQSATRYVGPASIAIVYGALGHMDEAFRHLAHAYEVRDQRLVHAEHAATFDPMRTDARFEQLRRNAALPD